MVVRLFRVQEVQGSNPCGPNEMRAEKTTPAERLMGIGGGGFEGANPCGPNA